MRERVYHAEEAPCGQPQPDAQGLPEKVQHSHKDASCSQELLRSEEEDRPEAGACREARRGTEEAREIGGHGKTFSEDSYRRAGCGVRGPRGDRPAGAFSLGKKFPRLLPD